MGIYDAFAPPLASKGGRYVINRRDLDVGEQINILLIHLVIWALINVVAAGIVGGLVSVLRATFTDLDFSWSVFLWWGFGVSVLLTHNGLVGFFRWWWSTEAVRSKLLIRYTIGAAVSSLFSGEQTSSAVWIKDADEPVEEGKTEPNDTGQQWEILHQPKNVADPNENIVDAEYTEVVPDKKDMH